MNKKENNNYNNRDNNNRDNNNKDKKIRLEDINKKNVTNYIKGTWNYWKFKHNYNMDKHIIEQAFYRAFLCINCLERTYCDICGCATPAMFFSPDKEDARERWKEMLGEKEWKKFKEKNNIVISDIKLELK